MSRCPSMRFPALKPSRRLAATMFGCPASPVPSPPLVSSCVPSAEKAPVRAVPFILSVPTICMAAEEEQTK